jgi:hypothetical protein
VLEGMDPKNFGMNIYLLIGLVLLAAAALLAIIAAWTLVNHLIWKRGQRRAERAYQAKRIQPDGTPYPPASRGICSKCAAYRDPVYHLDDGSRLCEKHFDEHRRAQPAPPH